MSNSIIHQNPINDNGLSYLKDYLQAGFNIVPLKERSKIPVVKWKPLLKQPLTEEELAELYQTNPKLNIGIITGSTSGGLVIFDIDHSPPEELAFLIAQYPTATVRTSRGRHYYYRSKKKIKNQIFDWGEFRADGLYVVAPPSVHPSGAEYQFLDGYGLNEMADLPDKVLGFLTTQNSIEVRPKKTLPSNVLKSSLLGNQVSSSGSVSSLLGNLQDTYQDPEIALNVAKLCGINVSRLGAAFKCPIHADNHPSATLIKGNNGTIVLHEFHRGNKVWLLPEVYASCICHKKEYMKLSRSQLPEWWIRALADIGRIQLPEVKPKLLPHGVSKGVKAVYEGFILLLKVRKFYNPNQAEEAPFSWGFACDWCNFTRPTIQKGLEWLLKNGYLEKTKEAVKCGKRRSALYRLRS